MARLLDTFSIEASQCYCCSNGHRHPDNGDVLPCDRQLVLRTLAAWYQADGTAQEHLKEERACKHFDKFVQENLTVLILKRVGVSLGMLLLAKISMVVAQKVPVNPRATFTPIALGSTAFMAILQVSALVALRSVNGFLVQEGHVLISLSCQSLLLDTFACDRSLLQESHGQWQHRKHVKHMRK
eukprot:TRINITY_DN20665_c0_g1_i2.p1 TRINITY_DN20665_c0_g1~~TRINITY_DN20665_c0_g1_i2.p1  ORF type:complete len:216 (+),score=6.15 TRINITY_DN20665_c0_g1_i2:98-649(+)